MSDYLYSSNITIAEVKEILKIMEEHDSPVVGLHFAQSSIMGPIHVTLDGIGGSQRTPGEFFDVTDYDSA